MWCMHHEKSNDVDKWRKDFMIFFGIFLAAQRQTYVFKIVYHEVIIEHYG